MDENKNQFILNLKVKPNKIENKVIKLRCVDVVMKGNKPNIVKLTKLSSCLIIPRYFYDSRRFDKI